MTPDRKPDSYRATPLTHTFRLVIVTGPSDFCSRRMVNS